MMKNNQIASNYRQLAAEFRSLWWLRIFRIQFGKSNFYVGRKRNPSIFRPFEDSIQHKPHFRGYCPAVLRPNYENWVDFRRPKIAEIPNCSNRSNTNWIDSCKKKFSNQTDPIRINSWKWNIPELISLKKILKKFCQNFSVFLLQNKFC